MSYLARRGIVLLTMVLAGLVVLPLAAQQPAAAPDAARKLDPAGAYRKLAPGVMRKVDAQAEKRECYSWHDVVEILANDPNLDWAKQVNFHREIWFLNFEFKPLRMIVVDVPQPSGKMQRRVVKYMIYKVAHPAKAITPIRGADGTWEYKDASYDKPIRFIPEFSIEAPEYKVTYPERVVPVALGPIRLREDPNRRLLTSDEMAASPLKPGDTAWGVAMWDDLDPRIDRFFVYVQGLTNAYRWRDEPGKYQKGDPLGTGRILSRKTLKINFWRAGDEYYEHEREIRLGAPGEVDYEWIYR